jgi:polar amino acid transport system substrate-binding protein
MATGASTPEVPPSARAELAPTGTLRAGINYGNVILARKDPATGELSGVAIDLARELSRRLDVPITIVGFDTVGAMVDGAKAGAWDIAFLGSDPARAGDITFTAAYVELQATYLVPAGSPISEVDAAVELLAKGQAEALAGLRQALIGVAARLPGSRILDGQFMAVQQSMGVPNGRAAAAKYLRGFVEEAKASGLVARAIEKTGAAGVSVAPMAPTQ